MKELRIVMRMNVWRQKKGSVCVKIMAHATPLYTGMPRNPTY